MAQLKGIWEHSTKAVMSFSKKSREQGVQLGQEQQGDKAGPRLRGWDPQLLAPGCGVHSVHCTLAPLVAVHIGRPGLGCRRLEVCCTRARLLACLTPRFLKYINITRGFAL